MDKIESGFNLIALIDGTTINVMLRVEGTPLIQRYTKGTDKYIPNFETISDNEKPTIVVIPRDSASGNILTPSQLNYSYNGVAITFGSDGLSTNDGMVGFFKKVTDYSTTVGGKAITTTALRVMKNLVPISGYDNDKITVNGSVEVGGNQIAFTSMDKDVIIQETTGNQYDVVINNTFGSQILDSDDVITEIADIYKDGVKLVDVSGFSFKWNKMLSTGDTAMGTAQSQKITAADVDNKLKLRCDVYQGSDKVASGYDEITDFSDPIIAAYKTTGIQGNCIRSEETAKITPYAYKRGSGEVVETPGNWNWSLKDNEGKDFVLTGKSASVFSSPFCEVSYADMVRAKMGLSGIFGYSEL